LANDFLIKKRRHQVEPHLKMVLPVTETDMTSGKQDEEILQKETCLTKSRHIDRKKLAKIRGNVLSLIII
jgi:hypothetical protein